MTAHERLVRARNEIATKGWWRGTWRLPPDGRRRCAVLALDPLCCRTTVDPEATAVLCRVLGVDRPIEVSWWNDHPTRTVEDVLDLYDKAIVATAPEPDLGKVVDPDLELAAALGDLA